MICSFGEKESIYGRVGAQEFDKSCHDRKQMILKLVNLGTKLQQILEKGQKGIVITGFGKAPWEILQNL